MTSRLHTEPGLEPEKKPVVLHVRLPQPASAASVKAHSRVFTRNFRCAYTCIATQQGMLFKKGERGRQDQYIRLGEHAHTIEFTVGLDWSGGPDGVLIEDSSETASDAKLPIMNFMLATQAIVQTRLLADSRIAPYLNHLKIYVHSFITSALYDYHDQDSIDCKLVPPCDALRPSQAAEGAAEGFVLVLNDLLADITFGDAQKQKGISFTFPTLPQPSK
jgi:hypothetical protein